MLKTYFTFSRHQTAGILILCTAILFCLGFYFCIPLIYKKEIETNPEEVQKLMAKISINSELKYPGEAGYTASKLTPFTFDPNTLDSLGFKKLGLRDKLIHTILNYRSKGGKFYNKESLRRIYGLHEDEYAQLENYIVIAGANNYERKVKEKSVIELNSADTGELVKLYGIGSKLSMNIVKYRTQLGGFASVEQLKEVYGISEETFTAIKPQLRVDKSRIKKINLNEAEFAVINAHPYMKGELCKAICELRKKKKYHFENLEELKEIPLMTEEVYRKVMPYLSF